MAFPHYFSFWTEIGSATSKAVQDFFSTGHLLKSWNHTFVTLIPKNDSPTRVDHYRPIALCNVCYKIISKILVDRIKPLLDSLICPTQTTFVPGRNIQENIIICHEIMHHMKKKIGTLGLMALKIDMAKAYDRVEWSLLLHILKLHGFSDEFINLIYQCISSPTFSFLINGSPFGMIKSSRGLRQGDPLSPGLFVIFLDLLARLLCKVEANGDLHGIKISRGSPPISNLIFVDDLTVFCRVNMNEADVLLECLNKYRTWSGLAINCQKSSIHFSSNVSPRLKPNICQAMGMPECNHRSSYLGLPFCKGKSSTKAFLLLIDKLKGKLGGWKSKNLSKAGRTVLVRHVAQSLPIFAMQSFNLPRSICTKMDALMRDFWWGFPEDGRRHLYLTSWKSVCSPKQASGLGVKLSKEINASFMTKMAWELLVHPSKAWVQLIRAKYLRGRQLLSINGLRRKAPGYGRASSTTLTTFAMASATKLVPPLPSTFGMTPGSHPFQVSLRHVSSGLRMVLSLFPTS